MKYDVYVRGSRIYGTARPNSDMDVYVISETSEEELRKHGFLNNYDVHWFLPKSFQKKLNNHDIDALECYYHYFDRPSHYPMNFVLDPTLLRSNVAEKASNSWVKAKKKFIDGEIYIAKKSAWHAIRMLDFACQILEKGIIMDFSSMNHLYDHFLNAENWDQINNQFGPLYKKYRSKLRELAPKEI